MRKNIGCQVLTAIFFIYCMLLIAFLSDKQQSNTLSKRSDELMSPLPKQPQPSQQQQQQQQRQQDKYQQQQHPEEKEGQHVEEATPRTQEPVPKTISNVSNDEDLMKSQDAMSKKIIARILTAFTQHPTRPPERVNPALQHIQNILNRFRYGDSYYYADEYDYVDKPMVHRGEELINVLKTMSIGTCKEYERAAAMTRLIVPDILEHAQYMPDNGEFVTLIAHMTEDRLPRLDNILQHWNGPVSVALYINIDHLRDFIYRLLDIEGLKDRDNVLLHLVPEEGEVYPVNYLRNAAINNTRSRYIFLSDIDFIPVIGSHNILLEDLQGVKGEKKVFVIPAFEESRSDKYEFPQSKSDLIELWEREIIVPFHLVKFPSGHHRTDFRRWRYAQSPYKIAWEPLFEPYIAGERAALPLYSQMFVGRGKNKIQQIVETVAMGFEMIVEPEIFVVHLKHEQNRHVSSQDKYLGCSDKAMKDFNKYILTKYGFSGQ